MGAVRADHRLRRLRGMCAMPRRSAPSSWAQRAPLTVHGSRSRGADMVLMVACGSDDDELQERVLKRRPSSASLVGPHAVALEDKLELALGYLFAHLAVQFSGTISCGPKRARLSDFLTEDQTRRYLKEGGDKKKMAVISWQSKGL